MTTVLISMFAKITRPFMKGGDNMSKNFRDAGITLLALGTAYGLGILSCIVYEVKLFVECCEATKKKDENA